MCDLKRSPMPSKDVVEVSSDSLRWRLNDQGQQMTGLTTGIRCTRSGR